MPKLPLLVLFFTALLGACSSDSGSSVDETPVGPDKTPGLVSEDDTSNQLSASNYEAVVTTSMNLLRANYFPETVELLDQLAEFWGTMLDAVVGVTSFDCPQGGVVTRNVTLAPGLPESGLPDLNTQSTLLFDACSIGGETLSGEVQWDWDQSSPTQLSATSYHNNYRFNQLMVTTAGSEKRLNGTHDRLVTIAGPGDSYTVNSMTDSFVQSSNGATTIVSNANYTQQYSHFIAQSDQANGILHEFSESGSAQLQVDGLGLIGAMVSINPEMVYANEQTAGSVTHTSALASGGLNITLPNKATLSMTSDSSSADSVVYSIIGSDQQEVVIEREWITRANCVSDERFNYASC